MHMDALSRFIVAAALNSSAILGVGSKNINLRVGRSSYGGKG